MLYLYFFAHFRWEGGGDKGEPEALHHGAGKGVWRAGYSLQLHQNCYCQEWVSTAICKNMQSSSMSMSIATCSPVDRYRYLYTHTQTEKYLALVKRIRDLSASYVISSASTAREGHSVLVWMGAWNIAIALFLCQDGTPLPPITSLLLHNTLAKCLVRPPVSWMSRFTASALSCVKAPTMKNAQWVSRWSIRLAIWIV